MSDQPAVGRTPAPDPAAALEALAGQVERLRRAQEDADIAGLRSRLGALAATMAGLMSQVAELADTADTAGSAEQPTPSWLSATAAGGELLAPETAGALLADLISWLAAVYLRFAGGDLPECWLWHPDVVEELLWLRGAWSAAYCADGASVQRVGDWHDRLRPGVVRRIGQAAGDCSLRVHLDAIAAPAVPAADAADVIAAWWAGPRGAAPVPTGEQIQLADAAHSGTAAVWR